MHTITAGVIFHRSKKFQICQTRDWILTGNWAGISDPGRDLFPGNIGNHSWEPKGHVPDLEVSLREPNRYIAFKYVGDYAHDLMWLDFQVGDIPYCNPNPISTITAYTDSTLTVSWDAVPNQDTYEITWGPLV